MGPITLSPGSLTDRVLVSLAALAHHAEAARDLGCVASSVKASNPAGLMVPNGTSPAPHDPRAMVAAMQGQALQHLAAVLNESQRLASMLGPPASDPIAPLGRIG